MHEEHFVLLDDGIRGDPSLYQSTATLPACPTRPPGASTILSNPCLSPRQRSKLVLCIERVFEVRKVPRAPRGKDHSGAIDTSPRTEA